MYCDSPCRLNFTVAELIVILVPTFGEPKYPNDLQVTRGVNFRTPSSCT